MSGHADKRHGSRTMRADVEWGQKDDLGTEREQIWNGELPVYLQPTPGAPGRWQQQVMAPGDGISFS